MYTTRFVNLKHVLPSAVYIVIISLSSSTLVYVLYSLLGLRHVSVPLIPVTLIGTAVSFYVGFKNNSSYDRLWEARRIWGSITNASRMWSAMVTDLVMNSGREEMHAKGRQMILRHIAWCNALRLQLRRNKVWSEKYYQNYVSNLSQAETEKFEDLMEETLHRYCDPAELDVSVQKQNVACHLLHLQNRDLKYLKTQGVIDPFEHNTMTAIITDLYNQQGGCERIKGYPFPRQYAIFSRIFVDMFICLLPFGLVAEIARITPGAQWLLMPVCLVVAWIFNAMEQVGDFSENPFENAVTDIPITAICRNIEIDLLEMMNEKDLPERLRPVDGILM